MIIAQRLDYRYAEDVLSGTSLRRLKREIVEVLQCTSVPLLDPKRVGDGKGGVKRRKRPALRGSASPRFIFLPVDQIRLNAKLDAAFRSKEWDLQPQIVTATATVAAASRLRGDFKKHRVQIEVQFGNMARWYTDVFKFQLSYSLDAIDVGVLIVPMQRFANLIDENVAYFERVARELPAAKMSLTLPIWVLGVEPDDYDPIEVVYNRAFGVTRAEMRAKGIEALKIPMTRRQLEEDPDDVGGD
jgi:hypothetical protein